MKTKRNTDDNNYIPYSIYPYKYLPAFIAGSFYILPKFSIWLKFINSLEMNSEKLIYREDIQMGIYFNKSNIKIIKINIYYPRKKKFRKCKDYQLSLAVHGINNDNNYYIYKHCYSI